jgi:hypothetical protein
LPSKFSLSPVDVAAGRVEVVVVIFDVFEVVVAVELVVLVVVEFDM